MARMAPVWKSVAKYSISYNYQISPDASKIFKNPAKTSIQAGERTDSVLHGNS
jgi:hypothetical protein